jgi:hypothetical protein
MRRISRSQQRRLNQMMAADEAAGRGSVSDRAFFEANPNRRYRMRLATQYEITAAEILDLPLPMSGHIAVWSVVKHMAPGARLRLYVYAPIPVGPYSEIPEELAREIFGAVS